MKNATKLVLFVFIFFSTVSISNVLSYSSNDIDAMYVWDTGGIITVNGTQQAAFTLYYDPSGARTLLDSYIATGDVPALFEYPGLENGEYEMAFGWNIPDVYGLSDPSDDLAGSEQRLFIIADNVSASIVKTLVKPDPPVLTEYGEDMF